MSNPLALTFLTSAPSVELLPDSRAEVAVMGRSNVGKSSLLNALARQKDLAKVSSTPGRTQLLNAFQLDGSNTTVIDLPGYGYAKAPKKERLKWQARMETYLLEREPLVLALLLVDGEIGPAKNDVEMLQWLRFHQVPHTIIATKHDKVKSSHKEKRKRDLAAACGVERSEILWVSASKNVNLDKLRGMVRAAVAKG